MKIRINLTEAKAPVDPKKAAADKKAADKKAADKKAAAKKVTDKKAEEKEKAAEKKKALDKKAKLKESLYPMIAKMIKENNGFGATVEEEGINEEMLDESTMDVVNQAIQSFSDIAEHGSMQTKVLGQVLQALGAAGMTIPVIKAIIDKAKVKIPRAFKAADKDGGEEKGSEPQL
jgi:hypothetical protein